MGETIGNVIVWIALMVFGLKTLWNIGVPYAMIRSALKHPESRHGWSLFIMLDLGLLAMATIGSLIARDAAVLSIMSIAAYGILIIVAMYLHLAVVLFVGGYLFDLFPKQGNQQS
jgi:hypothetical protein